MLYWYAHEPAETMVTAFLEESTIWHEQELLPLLLRQRWLDRCWPLLALALECQSDRAHDTLERLRSSLNGAQEIAIGKQVYAAIEKHVQRLSSEQQEEFALRLYSEAVDDMPEVNFLVERLGLAANQLINKYLCSYTFAGSSATYSAAFMQRAFAMSEEIIDQPQKVWIALAFLVDQKWSKDQETLSRGKQFLSKLIEKMFWQSALVATTVALFLKLLSVDQSVLSLAPSLLSTLAEAKSALAHSKEELPISMWTLARIVPDIPLKHLAEFAHFTRSQDEKIQQGAGILWEALIEAVFNNLRPRSRITASSLNSLETLRLDWRIGFALLNEADAIIRKRGITLLTLSDYPVAEQNYSEFLLHAMARAQDEQEITAWAFFLQHVPTASQQRHWQVLSKQILQQPRFYTTGILAAAKERYSALVGEAGPDITGDAKALGLPD
jgi:hypothetical protein